MADNKRWFKVWNSILTDPAFDVLPNLCAGVWVKLGALVSKQGCNGNITVTKKQFFKWLNVSEKYLPYLQKNLSTINVILDTSCNGNISVTFSNWRKYQEFTDSYMRVKKFRDKHNDNDNITVTKEEKKKRREENKNIKNTAFVPPSVEEVQSYCKERNNGIDGHYWVDYYTTRGWMVGKQKMKDWRAAVRTWERNKKESISDQYPDL